MIDRLDGELTVDEAIAAQRVESPVSVSSEVDASVVNTVRALVVAGIMEPGDATPSATPVD